MSFTTALTLFAAMVVVALLPGPGILTVVARTLGGGLRHGVYVTLGIILGDYVFISFALLGLAALSEALGSLFDVVKYAGAAYLCYLGGSIALAGQGEAAAKPLTSISQASSFAAGLLVTLSNPKAILFYLSFFPAFVDITAMSLFDACVLYAIATIAVGGVMLAYAYLTHRATGFWSPGDGKGKSLLRYGSGALLIASGAFLILRV